MTLYAEQQTLALSQARLESVSTDLQAHTAQRLYREADMKNVRKLYKNIADQGSEMKRQGEVKLWSKQQYLYETDIHISSVCGACYLVVFIAICKIE